MVSCTIFYYLNLVGKAKLKDLVSVSVLKFSRTSKKEISCCLI